MVLLAHGGPGHLIEGAVHFGRLWLVLLPNLVLLAGTAALLWRRGRQAPPVTRLGDGAAALTGLPDWVALPVLTMLTGALPTAVLGFYWDVAWHIDIGRDEFLFSPPHIAILAGLGLIGMAGWFGVVLATRRQVPTAWRLAGRGPGGVPRDAWRVPLGAAALLFGSFIALVGFSFDELWHWAYGLDVSMWGPTHVTMISAAAFSPFALWTLLGAAEPRVTGNPGVVRGLRLVLAAVTVVGLSTWQLEFDLGVPQWQQLYHPVLVALAAGLSLTVARTVLGRGGALAAAAGAIAFRGLFSVEGGVPVFLPEDRAIGAHEVPVVPERTAPFESEVALLQREAHDGPAWPGIVAYTWVATSVATLLGILVAGFVALDRRRRAAPEREGPPQTLQSAAKSTSRSATMVAPGSARAMV